MTPGLAVILSVGCAVFDYATAADGDYVMTFLYGVACWSFWLASRGRAR